MMISGLGARFPAGALHDPLPRAAGFRPVSGLAPEVHRLPGLSDFPSGKSVFSSPVAYVMHRLALTVAGAAQALRKIAHLFPVYPRRRNVASAPEAAHYSRAGVAREPIEPAD
jgi:hypothetical protein